ncbi:MAG: hypothetical protein DRH12_08375 [Deltaproteobacteria bacterium]|nr:MAG: hypothetical protein DRH12_08375 [Deltaproteobacteria bacterium]
MPLLGILGGLAVVGRFTAILFKSSVIFEVVVLVMVILFVLMAILNITQDHMGAKKISADTIVGAVIVYLLLGIFYSGIYMLVETLVPGSFKGICRLAADTQSGAHCVSSQAAAALQYYSFVTLSTLGYGNITPITPLSRMLSWLEAICGQLYLAVTIARLVGIHIAQSMQER